MHAKFMFRIGICILHNRVVQGRRIAVMIAEDQGSGN